MHFTIRAIRSNLLKRSITGHLSSRAISAFANCVRDARTSVVIVSKCHDIYANLSLEHWLYTNCDLRARPELPELRRNQPVFGLLMWTNDPAIVIGRHQNPWAECNVRWCETNGVQIVRRNSGGGTVYHDRGNLNICFLSSKQDYCRHRNLSFIRETLKDHYNINSVITAREDLVLADSGHKISGTASKLAAHSAYHHCTLLVDVDTARLRSAIRKNKSEHMTSKATESVKSPIENLRKSTPELTMDSLVSSLATSFTAKYNASEAFVVEPSETLIAGFDEIKANLQTWDWIYGKTPRFYINTTYAVNKQTYEISLNVYHGFIEHCAMQSPCGDHTPTHLVGAPYKLETICSQLKQWTAAMENAEWSVLASLALITAIESTL